MAVSALLLAASASLRVASLDLCADEYLLLLARPGEIVSVSRLAHDRYDNVLWREGRRFPPNDGSIEDVVGRRPSLLVTTRGGGRASGAIASRLGIAVLALSYPTTIGEVEMTMVRVARALGDVHRADPWRRRLARLQRTKITQRDAIFLGSGGHSVSTGSLGAQWMALAGFQQRNLPGGRATLETLATRPPQVVLRSTYRRGQQSLGQRWLDHPLVHRSRGRAIDTDGRPWTCAGPLILGEIERLQALR
jgi:iron complex transport system substrate-binding protein